MATLDLKSIKTNNNLVNNYAVINIFFILSNQKEITLDNVDTEEIDQTIINSYNKQIFFINIISKEKKNNYVFHNAYLQ